MTNIFKWRKFNHQIPFIWRIRWYLRYALSYRDVVELLAERGIIISHTTVYRWVQKYAPLLNVEMRKHIKRTGGYYRVDETYIKVNGQWKYLYRAVDKDSQTIDFLFSAKRDMTAVKKFFQKALSQPYSAIHYVINTDKNPAYPDAIAKLQSTQELESNCKLRLIKYLNNIVEQDHRFVKRMRRHKQWFRKFSAARNTIAGFEIMHMLKKGQVKRVAKYDIIAQNSFIGNLLQKSA